MKKGQISLIEIAKLFLTIGTIGFGGGMAIIALMQDYCVKRKKWLSNDEFTHGVTFSQFMGPFAVNTAIFVGYRIRGFKGAIVAVTSFLAPSIIFVILLTALYLKFQSVPSFKSALNGVAPAAIALILSAAYFMGKNKIKSLEPILLVLITIILSVVFKVQVIALLLLAIFYGLIKVILLKRGVIDEDI